MYDSVAARPLAGAVVQLGASESVRAPWTTTTNTAGKYRISGLLAGRYVVGFYHDVLTTLGLDAPSTSVTLSAVPEVTIDLAVPSSATIRALRCGASTPFRQGMIVGYVRDVASRAAVDGANAEVHWRAMALDSANYHVVQESQRATIEPDGSILFCGLPVDAPLDLRVTAPNHQAIDGTVVNVPTNGIGRLDVLLVDSALRSGSAVIRGRVVRQNGKAVNSGRVTITSLARDVPIRDGEFSVGGLPAGSWIAESRVIGVEPQQVLVTAADSGTISATITVNDAAQILDAVTVIGKPERNLTVLDEVLRRKRLGMGTVFLPGHPALKSALFTADVMREARGFQYKSPTEIIARTHCRNIAVYVDDTRQADSFDNVELVAPVSQVLAIETFPDILSAPVRYRNTTMFTRTGRLGMACALVLIWTKRPF